MNLQRIQLITILFLLLIISQGFASETLTATTRWQVKNQQPVLVFEFAESTWMAYLHPVQVRGTSFQVWTQSAAGELSPISVPPSQTWVGQLAERPDSRVLVHQSAGHLRGMISLPGTESTDWIFDQLAGLPCKLTQSPARGLNEGTCGVVAFNDAFDRPLDNGVTDSAAKDIELAVRLCTVAVDTDVEYYTACGGTVEATMADIELIIAGTSAIYERDAWVALELGDVILRTEEPTPYVTTNPYALLDAFSDEWRNNMGHIERDVVHYFTGKNLDGSTLGIAWDAEGVCSSYQGYSLVQSRFAVNLADRLALTAHELGHNFDLNHCDYGDYWCRIMCSTHGGCSGGQGSFGTMSTNRLLDEVADMECLDMTTVTHHNLSFPFSDDFSTKSALNPEKWTAVDQAHVSYGRLELESGDAWGVNELGTARTHPMTTAGLARIRFKARSYGLPAGQPLRVEVFDSTNWQWILLGTVISTGGSSNSFVDYEFTSPPETAGSYFSLRFTADGNGGDYNDEWHIDDVTIDEPVSSVPSILADDGNLIRDVSPNPFNPSTTVTVTLARSAHLEVAIYDLAGRLVADLHNGHQDKGEHQLVWNGRTVEGLLAGSGSYLLKVAVGDQTETQKLLLLK